MDELQELYVWVADNPDTEGPIAMHDARMGGWLPMFTSKRELAFLLRGQAEASLTATGKTGKLLRFTNREVVEVIDGS